MLKKSVFPIFFILTMFASMTFAQKVYTPERGSAERKAIFDALRVPVEKELKQDILFAVSDLNVSGNWAFIGGEPQTKEGGLPDYRNTKYQEALEADMFDNNIFALLKKTGKKWRVVVHYIGCTDVCYATWWKDHKAPKAIFPYTE